jgi:hypothetical protein
MRIRPGLRPQCTKENISSGKCDALVTVKKALVVDERFHQSSSLFFDRSVIAGLQAKNGGLYGTLIADTIEPAEDFDYTQAVNSNKRAAQSKVVRMMVADVGQGIEEKYPHTQQ